jgi:O-antigen/teichoic acid export membrane protein
LVPFAEEYGVWSERHEYVNETHLTEHSTPKSMRGSVKRGQSSRLGANAIFNVSGSVAYYFVIVLITPVAIKTLGDDAWGIWQLVGATASYAMLLSLGLNSAIAHHVARSAASDDFRSLGHTINDARLYFLLASGAIIVLLSIGGPPLIASLVGESDASLAFRALIVSVTLTALTLPPRVFTSVVTGLQRFDLVAGFRVLAGVLLLVITIVGFRQGMGLLGFAAAMTAVPATPAMLSWVAAHRILPPECFRWRKINFSNLTNMVHYSINTVIYIAGTVILYQTSKFIASWRCGGPAAAGYMGLAINLTQVLSVVFIALSAVVQPRVSDLHARGMDREIGRIVRQSLAATGLLAVPLIAFLFSEAAGILNAWVGRAVSPDVVVLVARTVRGMLVGQGLYVVFLPCFYALLGVGEHRVFGVGMVATGVISALLGWGATYLRPVIDVLGIVFGVSLAALVLVVTLPITLRRFSLSATRVLRDALLIPLLVACPGLIAAQYRPRWNEPLLDLALGGVIFGACVLPGWYLARWTLDPL